MNYKLTKFVIFVLTIFLAELVTDLVKHYLHIKTGYRDPYMLTAIQMGIIIAIYYPVFTFIHHVAEHFSKHFISKTQQATGSGVLGIVLAFAIGLGILYIVFLKLWFHIAVWEVLWKKI